MSTEMPPQNPDNPQAGNQQPPEPTTEQLKAHGEAVDWAYRKAGNVLGVVAAISAAGTFFWHTTEARGIGGAANLKGEVASALSHYPYYDQAVGECLLIPEGRTVVGQARELDDACMSGREEADAIKSRGETYLLKIGAFAVTGWGGLSFARRRSRAKNTMRVSASLQSGEGNGTHKDPA